MESDSAGRPGSPVSARTAAAALGPSDVLASAPSLAHYHPLIVSLCSVPAASPRADTWPSRDVGVPSRRQGWVIEGELRLPSR